MSVEQQARDLLERMGFEDAQGLTAGDVVELANLLSKANRLPTMVLEVTPDFGATLSFNTECNLQPGDRFDCFLRRGER